jgi:hypothetical protein
MTADNPETWRRSSACLPSDCVEVAIDVREVWVRDSADPYGPVLRVARAGWRSFISRIAADSALALRHGNGCDRSGI